MQIRWNMKLSLFIYMILGFSVQAQQIKEKISNQKMSSKKDQLSTVRKPTQEEAAIKISVFSEDYPTEPLQKNPYYINDPAGESYKKMISPEKRERIFEKCGVTEHTNEMDELDRDLFILRAQNYTLESLIQLYPGLPVEKLKKIKESILREKTDE